LNDDQIKEIILSLDSQSTENQGGAPEGLGLSLPRIINILFRGRRTIVYLTLVGVLAGVGYGIFTKPLYRATGQVRPGIVSYTDQGAPLREWALKDIVRWFRTGLYWDDMRVVAPFDDLKVPPIILAEFISGPQFTRGGDVITLTNLSTDPLVAMDVLKIAIASFNAQASRDSSSSSLQLTLGGSRVRMEKIQHQIDRSVADVQHVDLEIKQLEADILVVEASARGLDEKLKRLRYGRKWRETAAAMSLAEAEAARLRLAEAEKLLQTMMTIEPADAQGGVGDDDPVSLLLLDTVKRNESALAGELLRTVNELSAYIYHSTVRADTLKDTVADIDMQIGTLVLQRDIELVQKKQALLLAIMDLEIKKTVELPNEVEQLKTDLLAEQVQVDMLSPIEQVGRVTVTQKPVRPRKLRALAILTFLAFMGSIFVVFFLEYYRRNKEAIVAREIR
jgi:Chain length determinant protein